MRDRGERVCSFYWDMEAALTPKDKQIELAMARERGRARRIRAVQGGAASGARTQAAPPLNIKVLVNFAPQNYDAAALRPLDTVALVSILRRISREPQFGKFSRGGVQYAGTASALPPDERGQDRFSRAGRGDPFDQAGTVDLKRLSQKHGDTEFLTDLIKKEMQPRIIRTRWYSPAPRSCWMRRFRRKR